MTTSNGISPSPAAAAPPTPKPEFTFRPAVTADAAALAGVAARAFPVGHAVDPADIAAYVDAHFTPAVLAAELQRTDSTFYVAEAAVVAGGDWEDGPDGTGARSPIVAFAVLTTGTSDASLSTQSVPPSALIELQRVYADPAVHGSGAARALVEHALVAAAARGFRAAWLGVWQRNPRAQAFYRKLGFRKVGEHGVWVGEDLHTDDILVRDL